MSSALSNSSPDLEKGSDGTNERDCPMTKCTKHFHFRDVLQSLTCNLGFGHSGSSQNINETEARGQKSQPVEKSNGESKLKGSVSQKDVVWPAKDNPRGYPQLAAFMNSDDYDSFAVYRRFGVLNSRLLLNKQDELRELEHELRCLDEGDFEDPLKARALRSRERDQETNGGRRQNLLKRIEKTFREYVELLTMSKELRAFNRPSERDWTSINLFCHIHKPLCAIETTFLRQRGDLVSLRAGRDYARLDTMVEKILRWIPLECLKRRFRSEEAQQLTTETEIYFSRSRIDIFVAWIITFLIVILMVVPVYLLFWIESAHEKPTASPKAAIGVLVAFTLAFTAVLSSCTKARRHEILGASAAYCAVLVVFIGNFTSNNASAVRNAFQLPG